MELFSLLVVGTGLLCIVAGWLISGSGPTKKPGFRKSRGIISKIEVSSSSCFLTVSFSSPEGTIFYHRTAVEKSTAWYEGMPLLVYYSYREKQIEVLEVQTYGQAYGKGFAFLLAGLVLVIFGTAFF